MTVLDPIYLDTLFTYYPDIGVFQWNYRNDVSNKWNTRFAGKQAGSFDPSTGYIKLRVHGKNVYAHRVAWAMYYREDPGPLIDHKDTYKTHNWIDNLRKNSHSGNTRNTKTSKNNQTGYTGVYYHAVSKKYRASITIERKIVSLGYYRTAIQASKAYQEKLKEVM